MKRDIKHYVILLPKVLKYFDEIKGTVISEKGIISCFDIVKDPHFLEIDALSKFENNQEGCVHVSIPYSFVLCITSSLGLNLKQIHGFRDSE